MAGQKKNGGCLGSAIKLLFFILALGLLINLGAIALLIIPIAYLVFLLFRSAQTARSPLGNINFDSMNGHEFERFCGRVLRGNGFSGVKITQGSGDHGIDILANKNGQKYAIQCKCYSSNIGNRAIQEAYSGKAIYGYSRCDDEQIFHKTGTRRCKKIECAAMG